MPPKKQSVPVRFSFSREDIQSELRSQGREMGLSAEQVSDAHFGAHTLQALRMLIADNPGALDHEYARIRGLNEHEVTGVIEFGLQRAQVSERHFGAHTLEGMRRLVQGENALNVAKAYERLRGFIPSQVDMVLRGTSREEVLRQSSVRVGDFMVPAPGRRVNHSGEVQCVIL